MENLLEIKDLYANAEDKEILKGLNLTINKGETHVIMGPNGAGKSTLANVIFNNPAYTKKSGSITFDSEDITSLTTDKIAKKGVFMSFQSPEEIPGISTLNFLKYAKGKITEKPVKLFAFKDTIASHIQELNMNPKLIDRNLNVGFSGGEKKKNEILQMLVLEENAVLIITHNTRILENLKVDYVHILVDGKIVKTGGPELAKEIEENGYAKYKTLKG